MNKKIAITAIAVILVIAIIVGNLNKNNNKDIDDKYKILTSFYPIYIMTLNITDGAENVEISNMADRTVGCIHDYTLITSDLRKFEKADVFIQNGLGLESFIDKVINSYQNIKVIESAKDVQNIIEEEHGVNGHVWLSIENYITQIKAITENLSRLNEENREIYELNCQDYINKLRDLQSDFERLKSKNILENSDTKETDGLEESSMYGETNRVKENGRYKGLNNIKAICLNEALEYLLEELEIEATMIETDHEQSALSAKTIKEIIDKMKEEDIKVIFIDKNDDTKTAEILANETGAKIYALDSGMNGKDEKDSYLYTMKYNYEVLKTFFSAIKIK